MNNFRAFLAITMLILTVYGCTDTPKKETINKPDQVVSEEKPEKKTEKTLKKIDPALQGQIDKGQIVYTTNCAVCHQKSGGGVPNLNPPLKGTDYILGDKTRLISFILKGSSEQHLEVKGETYSNVMPSFSALDDSQIADVLTYARNSFGNQASPISQDEVKDVRQNGR